MASELKPCLLCEGEAKLLRRSGAAGRVCPSKWYRERVECKVCGLTTREYKSPGAATRSWNTRPTPVAPVSPDATGKCGELVTVRYEIVETLPSGVNRWQCVEHECHANIVASATEFPSVVNALCHCSQAVELLAAERADKRIWMEKAAVEAERVERLEADNAAQTARVKEWEKADRLVAAALWEKKVEALEAKLAAAEEVAQLVIQAEEDKSGDPNLYILLMQTAYDKARAALGGEPS